MGLVKLVKTKLQNGMDFWYRDDDKYIGERIALQKYEEYESELILRNVNINSVVVDVGANIGYYTLLLAKVCKKVYAFEPDFDCFKILLKNIAENKLQNVVAINKAVSDKKEVRAMIKDKSNLGNSRLDIRCQISDIRKIETVKLDDEIREKVDLIKIDVQGWEPKVIMGAKKMIKKYKPILFLEFNGDYKMILFLKKYYNNIFMIDYWFYILKKDINIDRKTGYADLFLTNKNINIWERYKNLQWKKVIKTILRY